MTSRNGWAMGIGVRFRRDRLRIAVVAAVGAMLAVSGCASQSGSVVAYVGREGAQVTQRQVDEAVAGVSQTLQPGQQVSQTAVINVLIQGTLADQIAADHSIAITDAERAQAVGQTNLAPLLAVPAAKSVAFDVADTQIVGQRLGASAYLAEIKARPVKLNPRFGILDENQKTIVQDSSGSLSTPAPGTSPTPSP